MFKTIKICEKGHEFGSSFPFEKCPYDGTPLSIHYKGYAEFMLSHNPCSHLPKLPWFYESFDKNESDQMRSYVRWSDAEMDKLKDMFEYFGIADVQTWKKISEEYFERSLYAVEYKLRYIVYEYFLENSIGE